MKILTLVILIFTFSSKCIGQISKIKKIVECPDNLSFTKQKDCIFSISCNIGNKYSYSTLDYGSIGAGTEYAISNKSILKVSKKLEYDKPQLSGETGGDSGTMKYIFTALEKGKTTLTFKKIYREETYQRVIYIFDVK